MLKAWAPADGWLKWFCAECGSAVYSQHPERPEMISMRMGGFDEDPGVRPAIHQFVAHAASWEPLPGDGLPRFPERAPQIGPK